MYFIENNNHLEPLEVPHQPASRCCGHPDSAPAPVLTRFWDVALLWHQQIWTTSFMFVPISVGWSYPPRGKVPVKKFFRRLHLKILKSVSRPQLWNKFSKLLRVNIFIKWYCSSHKGKQVRMNCQSWTKNLRSQTEMSCGSTSCRLAWRFGLVSTIYCQQRQSS